MGTPEFAVPSLQKLVENNYKVVAVITALDKPRGRGQQIIPSPVKKYAESVHIPVLQPTNLKDPNFKEELGSYNANLQVVVFNPDVNGLHPWISILETEGDRFYTFP